MSGLFKLVREGPRIRIWTMMLLASFSGIGPCILSLMSNVSPSHNSRTMAKTVDALVSIWKYSRNCTMPQRRMHHLVQRPPHNAMCSLLSIDELKLLKETSKSSKQHIYGHFTWMQSRHENAARSCVSSVLVRPYMQGSGLADLRFSSLSRGSWLHKSLGKLSLATLDTLRIETNWVPQTLENSWEFCVPNCRWGTHLFQVKGLVDFALASFANDV